MKTNFTLIEQLEGRQLLSGTLPGLVHVGAARPTVGTNAPMMFAGVAVDSQDEVMATLQMTVQKTATGFSDAAIVTDDGGNVADISLSLNAAGKFVYHGNVGGALTLSGALNAGHTAITGTWIHSGSGPSSHGTLTMAVDPSTPTSPTTANYVGTATNKKGDVSQIGVVVTDTNNIRTAVLSIANGNGSGSNSPAPFLIAANGSFAFSFSQPNGETDHVIGKISPNGLTITGGWTSLQNGKPGSGKISLTLA